MGLCNVIQKGWYMEAAVLEYLEHNGVVVPEPPKPRGLKLRIRGEWRALTPAQEEMALAWAKKHGTPYVGDPVFVANFMADFSAALGLSAPLSPAEVDFAPAIAWVEAEKEAKAALTPEERKLVAAERKAAREQLKARYGRALVNGEEIDLANYVVEPSGIFMGRGEHPLRGRWKQGATQQDITLNLSPDAPRPEGDWGEIIWQPESLWIARWEDKLSGKLKYVWPSDSASIKQAREETKFDKASELDARLDQVRAHIAEGLASPDSKRRQIATACYLIDALCLRVGDEKDEDEADTVGATTLRPEHVTIHADGRVEFRFLGKDSVLWHKTVELPATVIRNLEELIAQATAAEASEPADALSARKLQIFPSVSSRDVSAFLSEVVPWLSAKVFRTHHATEAVAKALDEAKVKPKDPDFLKWRAASLANREAAILCNHYKKASPTWERGQARLAERQGKAEERVEKAQAGVEQERAKLEALRAEMAQRLEESATDKVRERREASYNKRIAAAEKRIRTARRRERRAKERLGEIKAKKLVAGRSRNWNLGTSLKSYIDPRVMTRWGARVDYDALEKYYPTALRVKFAWARVATESDGDGDAEE